MASPTASVAESSRDGSGAGLVRGGRQPGPAVAARKDRHPRHDAGVVPEPLRGKCRPPRRRPLARQYAALHPPTVAAR
ncbi:hypothetical protein [Streptomyces sp. NPDC001068]|uniref:hypothetical protein n=1 Tax=Streptomyces sp. NPDC001068 TaxID=3364544 RepID=UPI0036B044ED